MTIASFPDSEPGGLPSRTHVLASGGPHPDPPFPEHSFSALVNTVVVFEHVDAAYQASASKAMLS
jgi:hypothetical protein